MNVSATVLVQELKLLRKGRGISATQLGERVGPALRAVCRISGNEDAAEIRRKVSDRLRALIAPLPTDLSTVVLAALGLHEQARNPFYQERVHWAARELDRDDRTIRRRIDEGIEQVAELALAAAPAAAPGDPSRSWHTENLRVTLSLDQPVPEAFEFRRIVADADDIAELDLALTLTTPVDSGRSVREDDLQVDVFHGGLLAARVMESSDRAGLALRLPSPLRRGERHELALRFRAAFRYPHYVCVPRHPVDLFELHVRFPTPAPAEILLLDQVFQEDAKNNGVKGPVLVPDGSGEIHLEFRDLVPGFAYGVRWTE
ncbi:hypothetical protein [Amycolatopsis magusensis]|uniref:Helix-turn-helix domain-containing protein n=1 Tax=Amycolatopsis magusensis TaxID=882444 RepID=A0ABS4Q3Z5_9PSEU|nr:hypothetical protein [Amycolatopsis magusensis]MBP2186409.1 hypothetical protein [Amycolatopsis magusensis]